MLNSREKEWSNKNITLDVLLQAKLLFLNQEEVTYAYVYFGCQLNNNTMDYSMQSLLLPEINIMEQKPV